VGAYFQHLHAAQFSRPTPHFLGIFVVAPSTPDQLFISAAKIFLADKEETINIKVNGSLCLARILV